MYPMHYLFDFFALEAGELRVAHRIPYAERLVPVQWLIQSRFR
jgi:hypothetical protein